MLVEEVEKDLDDQGEETEEATNEEERTEEK